MPSFEVPLGDELFIGGNHDAARDAEPQGELPGSLHQLAWPQYACIDGATESGRELGG